MAGYSIFDQNLLESFRTSRSEKSFRALYRKHTPVLYRIAFRFLDGNHHYAEEAVQETWARAIEKVERFKGNSSLRTWLIGIVINCSRELRRKKEKYGARAKEDSANPLKEIHNKIDMEVILGHLPEGYREVLVLHEIEGFTHKEIGELLGISEGTSKSQLSRARDKIREFLTSDHNTNTDDNEQ